MNNFTKHLLGTHKDPDHLLSKSLEQALEEISLLAESYKNQGSLAQTILEINKENLTVSFHPVLNQICIRVTNVRGSFMEQAYPHDHMTEEKLVQVLTFMENKRKSINVDLAKNPKR